MPDNHHILITGCAKRIGAALAEHLHAKSMCVSVQYRSSKNEAEILCKTLNQLRPGSAHALYADFSLPNGSAGFIKRCTETNSDNVPDILLCCASHFSADNIRHYVPEHAEETFRVNTHAQLDLATQFINAQDGTTRADIIFLSDYIADITPENFLSYGASRAALHHAAQSLARQAAAKKIRVNVIALGHVLPTQTQRQSHFDALCKQTPLGKATPISDIKAALDFLLSAESVTGQILYLDSGARINYAPYADVNV